MPVNVPPTATGKRRFRLPVETDPHKLVNYCCGLNYHKDEPPIKLKPDNYYPDWLWTLRLQPKPNSWEMEKGTKEYYLTLKEENKQQNYLKRLTSARPKKVVGKVLKDQQDYINRLRFAALAHLEDDAGLEMDSMETDWIANFELRTNKREYYLPVNNNRVIYMDKVAGNTQLKNWYFDPESTFKSNTGDHLDKRPSNKLKAFQDSKRRHRYAGT